MGVVKRTKTAGEGYDQPNDGSQVKMTLLAIMACLEYCVHCEHCVHCVYCVSGGNRAGRASWWEDI